MVMRAAVAVLAVVVATPPTASAQESVGVGSAIVPGADQSRARYQIAAMESVLERYVQLGARRLSQQVQSISPDMLYIGGAARARGFRLDGYGVFFDVEVPAALRQTMGWTARMMQQNDQHLDQALQQLRRAMNELDGRRRLDAETALKLLELRARPFLPRENPYSPLLLPNNASGAVQASSTTAGGAPVSANMAAPDGSAPATNGVAPNAAATNGASRAEDLAWMQNPDGAYEMEVREALIGAMLGYGNTLVLQPDEWLTVAARDNQTVVVPGDLTETVTVILRIKGSDLAELMAGRLSEQDARRRVEVREF